MDKPCFELKGSLFTLTVLQLFEDDLSLLEVQLKERIKMAPRFFNHTPLVIDLHKLSTDNLKLNFFDLRELLQSLSIIPVGVKGADKSLHTQLEATGMAILAEAKTHLQKEPPVINPKPEAAPALAPALAPAVQKKESSNKPTKIVKQAIRSGQQVYAPEGDLIIIGSVSTGAEILADGNIHIYGTLRGRALAGVKGNMKASIYCQSLQSELVSIAGIYLLSDDIQEDKIGASVQVYMEDDKLQMELI